MNSSNSLSESITLILNICNIVGLWKTLEKSGEPGWKGIIPIYNTYSICNISGARSMFKFAVISQIGFFASAIYFLFSLALTFNSSSTSGGHIVISLLLCLFFLALMLFVNWTVNKKLAHSYGQSTGFALGLTLVSPIFFLILGFTDNIQYIGPDGRAPEEEEYY